MRLQLMDQTNSPTVATKDEGAYWRANISLLLKLLILWFMVSFGCGVLLVDWLDQFSIFGFKLGFWMSQQGAIYIFIAIIFIYAWRMKKLEQRYGMSDKEENK